MARQTDLTPDVLVIGAGTAGFGAAIAAARKGLSTCLIEAGQTPGGVMASCPGMPWGAAYPRDRLVGGVMEELAGRLFAMSPPAAGKRPCTLANFGPEIVYDPEIATLTMVEMLEEAGVEFHPGTIALAPVMDGDRVSAVEIADRRELQQVRPKIVIDCSGDGDISARAGVPYALGGTSGNMMGVSLTFFMSGADWTRVFAGNDPYFTAHAARGIAAGRLHPDLAKLYMMKGFHPGTVFCNSVVIRGVDGTDPADVARATQEGRRRCLALARFLVDEVPGFETARMTHLGPTVGVRETRKLEGMVQITGADLAAATKFPDGVVACDNPIDDVMRSDNAMTHHPALSYGDYYTIPFRALVPQRVENLMFAGRIVSTDARAFASVRGMPQCMAMGQATGTAAALAIDGGLPVQRIDTAALIADLQRQGLRGLGSDRL
ncbi:FAD-dependent oxidoreductase [Marimonas arenosa]|uniref:FAD-dependent oxidoreductase n=1 Tax=Marimonas arenosa TaxID=1795305 RepID=A0AAE3WB93_9RHOB|nr:FAD-dependent oxidoreductase [Marimonas arenosa]MDQ2089318.1 FAD-dependent oxidoreductase [Marimonas arenosa]